ncbi:CoA-disulfide reductase [Paenibacillus sp. CGMCC 1.16610]|uniref:CoA-disulfide reductase n=1 Tax=Paenibacillus anseongense TaxID=2682845 RepID=A0ABW9UJL4_9BACL|nr:MULTISPECIES: CoA-disulfide reductase [Paenibacillus]MBA2941529.1 CoA-disulfide reductase [Paenibacillus sp. CGMCC 1.16610]MVQ40344.1 CoA-disulfide reductase [Paenibacillus anseongense]
MSRTIVIIGGVAGGASAAARLRRLNENDEIIMYERGEHISFANCGLPYYIGETITNRDKLLIQSPQAMKNRFGIDVRTQTEVTAIDRHAKRVTTRHVGTGAVQDQPYDILIMSPGAKPIVPDIPGLAEANHVFTLRNIPDTDRIKSYVDSSNPKHATILGGGFIGIEMAENLRHRGLEVTVIERNPQVLGPLDLEMAKLIERHLLLKGVKLIFNDNVQEMSDNGRTLKLQSGKVLTTDMMILSVGVKPESQLAAEAGLTLGVKGSIQVNEHMQTNDPSIYAIGDAAGVKDRVQGFETVVPLAWGANRQGRLVADHINGLQASYQGAFGTAIVKVFDLTAAVTGNNEKTLRRLGVPYEVIHIHPNSHAGYYPGAASMSMKLLFDKDSGRILGAQAVGASGVDKRIDVIATAMRGGLRADELADIELSYAPPYSSAKDPVNMAGYVAANMMDGLVETMQWHEVDRYVEQGGLLIDVRDEIERELGYIPGSVCIPLNDIREHLHDIPVGSEVAVSCQVGLRGYLAARILKQHGYRVRNVDGGYKTYSSMKETSLPPIQAPKVSTTSQAPILIDACGLQCPGPIMRVYETMKGLKDGEQIEVHATDFGFAADIQKWSEKTGNTLQSLDTSTGIVKAVVSKGQSEDEDHLSRAADVSANGTTMVVFSGDLDKTIAAFIIASGAAAMGKKVTMFFTFWGLNVLRKDDAPPVRKDGLETMFSMMMPKGTRKLPMSKMNMGGMGAKMIRHVMQRKNVESLESLMQGAIQAGVKLIACTMSMDIMGIKREELMDGIDYAGVASYLGDAEDAGLNLFI